jgi:ABC-type transport system involved in cytochrome c biogenesis permease subunit
VAIKCTVQGLLIYATMLLYLLALAATVLRAKRLGMLVYGLGFAASVASVAYRWIDVGHAPLSNLFEVFLFLGMAMFPLSVFCRRVLRIGGEGADMLIGAVLLFPAGVIFDAGLQELPPALQTPLFVPHVIAYVLGYAVMAKAALAAAAQLIRGNQTGGQGLPMREEATCRLVCIGFPLLTAGLVLGALWGKFAWGNWWNWDPKELWSLASWLVYAGYLHFRYASAGRWPRANAAIAIAGFVAILITLLWVNLSKLFAGLHSYA